MGIEFDYSTLARILNDRLNTNLASASPLSVRCFDRDDNIVILVEHPEDTISHPRRVFRVIRKTIEEKQVLGSILMYLVVHGKNEPELYNQITLHSPQVTEIQKTDTEKKGDLYINKEENINSLDVLRAFNRKDKTAFSFVYFLITMGIFGFSILTYALSRPCVINQCLLIPETQEFAQQSLSLLDEDNEYVSLEEIIKNLQQAILDLEKIPSWSKYSDEAKKLRNNYQLEIKKLNQAIKAIELADQATLITATPPISLKKSQQAIKLWQEAISLLQEFPQKNRDSFIRKKEAEYQAKLVEANNNLKQEKEAQKHLLSAQEASKLAISRQATAKSLENLKLVESTWKTAIERLEKIPIESSLYVEKQKVLENYVAKFVEAKKLTRQEELGVNLYNQSVKQSLQAQEFARNKQWNNAVSYWQNSIGLLGKIPKKSFQYQEAVKLVPKYQEQLYQANQQMQLLLALEKVNNDLKTICVVETRICTYSVDNNLIKVFVTNKYIEIIGQSSNNSLINSNHSRKVINHISQVEKNLKSISSKYSKSLEVYNPQGRLMIKYQPNI